MMDKLGPFTAQKLPSINRAPEDSINNIDWILTQVKRWRMTGLKGS